MEDEAMLRALLRHFEVAVVHEYQHTDYVLTLDALSIILHSIWRIPFTLLLGWFQAWSLKMVEMALNERYLPSVETMVTEAARSSRNMVFSKTVTQPGLFG